MSDRSVFIGYDPRESAGFAVCVSSIRNRLDAPPPIHGVVLDHLRRDGLFTRPLERREGILWDVVSDAPCATEFSISRFFTPLLARRAGYSGWALFMDCDMLVRADIHQVFNMADPKYAVCCVKHDHQPKESSKMDGQIQTVYPRKNWSSFCLFNLNHPANDALTTEYLNATPGRDLHAFSWLKDDQIGPIAHDWNFLIGYDDLKFPSFRNPSCAHFTLGTPDMPGRENDPYADEWRKELNNWAAQP